jgi:dipeptidyl aminopeptidase/acylaminoacyl peptidase
MAERLRAAGGTVELLVLPDAGRLFNFQQPEQASQAWRATLAWLDRYLHPAAEPRG